MSRSDQDLSQRDPLTPRRSISLDSRHIDGVPTANAGEEDLSPGREQPKHLLRRKKGRIFDRVILRNIGLGHSPTFSDPEDAPNRPHIVPPPERSNGLGGITPREKLSELSELLHVRTASSKITLQRLAELDSPLSAEERTSLLTIARSAAETALKEYNPVRHTQRPTMLSAGTLERNAAVPRAGMLGYNEYLQAIQVQAKELQAGVKVLDDSQEATDGIDRVRKCLDGLFNAIK